MLHLLYLLHGIADFLSRNTQLQCDHHSAKKVGDIALAQQLRGKLERIFQTGADDFKRRARRGVFHICSAEIGLPSVCYGIACHRHIVDFAGSNIRKIVVDGGESVCRECIDKFEFSLLHILYGAESFEMLLTDGSDDTHLRMHKIGDFLDVAGLFGAHLHNEHFIVGAQMLADGAHHSESGVETARRHCRREVLRENTVKIMLR